MHRFYQQNIIIQWVIALVMLGLLIIMFFTWLKLMTYSSFGIVFIFVFTPIGQFLISPMMKLMGVYKYISPMLLIYAPSSKRYDLHNGTSFDYLFLFSGNKSGINWQYQLLKYYIDGFLLIITEIEENKIPETIEVRGSSYFFSEQTMRRMGFEYKKTGLFEKLNLLVNYLDLIWMYSLAKGALSFPDLRKIKTASTSGKALMAQKVRLEQLNQYLSNKLVS